MDKVPRKKQKKPLKKPVFFMGVVFFALLCLGGIWLLNITKPLPDIPESSETIYLLPRSSDEIASVSLSVSNQESYTLLQDEAGNISLEGRPDIPLRPALTEAIFSALHQLEAVQEAAHLHDDAPDLSVYGLAPANASIQIRYRDGEFICLMMGSSVLSDIAQYYGMIQGSDHVYTVYSDVCDPLLYEKEYLRDFEQPDLDASLLDRITLTGSLDFSLYYTPSGWQMEAPFSYPLNSVKTDALLTRIEAMAFESCLGAPEEVDMDALGLTEPALSVTLTQAPTVISGLDESGAPLSVSLPEQQYRLLLGNETGKSGVYLQWEGMVYKASNFLLGFWKQLSADEFFLQNPVNFLINDLNFLSVRSENLSASYQIDMVEVITENNQIATDEYGRILYDAEITRIGQSRPMDSASFLSWYAALSGMIPSGKLPEDFEHSSAALAQLTLQSSSITREIALYPYDPFYLALSVDGECLYFVENSWLEKIRNLP